MYSTKKCVLLRNILKSLNQPQKVQIIIRYQIISNRNGKQKCQNMH